MRKQEIETLAAVVHGSLAVLHGLAMLYHIRRKCRKHAVIHGIVCVYDIIGVYQHTKEDR